MASSDVDSALCNIVLENLGKAPQKTSNLKRHDIILVSASDGRMGVRLSDRENPTTNLFHLIIIHYFLTFFWG